MFNACLILSIDEGLVAIGRLGAEIVSRIRLDLLDMIRCPHGACLAVILSNQSVVLIRWGASYQPILILSGN